MNRLPVIFLLILAAFGSTVNAQEVLKGTVINKENNTPIAGATIRQGGRIIVSDDNGRFLFTIANSPDEVLLEVSAIGYTGKDTTIRLPVGRLIGIALAPGSTLLDEVLVSTGYQQLPRERATGSFSFVDNNRFNEQVSTDVMSRLEAVANGFQVDRTSALETPRILVRGLSTIQGPAEPLIVVDNFPYEGDLNSLNPNDIENVTILKDAAAASIWGARAGNGVIVITTKKGRPGQPLRIEFNSNFRIGAKPDLFGLRQISSSDMIDVEKTLYNEGYYTAQINARNKPALSPLVELLIGAESAPPDEQIAINEEIERFRHIDVRNDFDKYIYRPSLNQQYFLGIRGGTDFIGWNISSGYDRNTSNLAASYERLNLRFQNTMKPAKGLTVTSGIYYTQSNTESGRPGYGHITALNNGLFPYAALADADGTPLPVTKQIRSYYLENETDPRLLDWRYYPLEDYLHDTNETAQSNMLLNAGVSYSLPAGLGLNLNYQYERQQRESRNHRDPASFAARDLVNSFTQIDEQNELVYIIPPGGILGVSNGLIQSHNARAQVNFNRAWADHTINAIAGGEIRHTGTAGNSNTLYGYDEGILTHANVDYSRQYPQYISGQNSFIDDGVFLTGTANRYVSLYTNIAYGFRDKYLLSLSGRRDASNLFGVNVNDKWNPLWSSGLSWKISKEKFYKLDWLPLLKLRATFGRSGNVSPDRVAVTTSQYIGVNPYTFTPYSRFTDFANPELAWEKVSMLNVGADFGIKNNRISGNLEFYWKKGTDLYGSVPIDYTAGVGTTITKNVASMKGRGMDVELNTRNIEGAFMWQSHLNLSLNREEVTDYYLPDLRASRFVGYTNSISGIEGKPVHAVFSYEWAGLDPETGEARGYLGNEVSKDYRAMTANDVLIGDLVYHGSTLPTVFGSLGNSFSYRNFSLGIRLTYKFGYYFRRETINYTNLYSSWDGHGDFNNRWQKPGDESITDIPSMVYPVPTGMYSFFPFTEPFVERGDHIRLQYINLGYEFTKAAFPGLPFRKLKLYMNLSNLGLLWKSTHSWVDPDFASAQSTSLPTPFACAFGLRFDM